MLCVYCSTVLKVDLSKWTCFFGFKLNATVYQSYQLYSWVFKSECFQSTGRKWGKENRWCGFAAMETEVLISYINNVCNKSRSLNWFLWEFNSKSFDFTSSPHFGIRKFLEEEKYDAIRIFYMKIYMPSNIVGCSKKVKSKQQNGKDKTLNLPYDVFCFLHSPQTILYLGFGHFVVSPVHYLFVWFRVWHFVVIFVWFRMARDGLCDFWIERQEICVALVLIKVVESMLIRLLHT